MQEDIRLTLPAARGPERDRQDDREVYIYLLPHRGFPKDRNHLVMVYRVQPDGHLWVYAEDHRVNFEGATPASDLAARLDGLSAKVDVLAERLKPGTVTLDGATLDLSRLLKAARA